MHFAPFFALPPSSLFIRLVLGAHIAAGTVALLAGLVPMLGRKGGSRHVQVGRVYTYCMVAVALTAVLLCLFQPLTQGRLFLTGVAVLSFYLSFTGWRAARRHSAVLAVADLVLSASSSVVGLLMVAAGVWLQAILFAFFGALICLFAGLDTWRGIRTQQAVIKPWIFRHFVRMGGSYISAATAFVVVNLGRWLPAEAPRWIGLAGWIIPTLLGSILISRAVRRYRARMQANKLNHLLPTSNPTN